MAAACIVLDQRTKGGEGWRGRRECDQCRVELGRIVNRGACCPGCRQRVCKSCRHFGHQHHSWLCTTCSNSRERRVSEVELMKALTQPDLTDTVRRSLQRSLTFSDRSESAWCFSRGSAEMRLYSSLPRHQDYDFMAGRGFIWRLQAAARPHPPQEPQQKVQEQDVQPEDSKAEATEAQSDTQSDAPSEAPSDAPSEAPSDAPSEVQSEPPSEAQSDVVSEVVTEASSVDGSPAPEKRINLGQVISRAREKRLSETSNFTTGVTPPAGRRKRLYSEEDPEEYKLVFISSSEGSELSDDGGSGLDWDYFESCRSSPGSSTSAERALSCRGPPHCPGRLVPVPVPVPVPLFVPVPWNSRHGMTEPLLKLYKSLPEDGLPQEPDSSSSSSESTDDESPAGFSRTFVVNPSDDEDLTDAVADKNAKNEAMTKALEPPEGDPIDSIITFSNVEVLQIMSEFIQEERKVYEDLESVCKEASEEVASDEFSGTESMGEDPEEEKFRTLVTVEGNIALEDGLADDDSWVEDLERDGTTTEDSEDDDRHVPDREEELRGYHRAIDFTLHTIVEESCEESEPDPRPPTDLEKYFFYGLGEGQEDTVSETSSIYSEQDTEEPDRPTEASSRLEKYFLSDFMGFSRRDSDGSVGSDSEGKPSPGQRRKRLVRGRGTARLSSLDNLTEPDPPEPSQSEGSDQEDQTSFVDGQFDTVKRTKKKKRSVSSAPVELVERCEDSGKEEEEGHRTPQPEDADRSKQQSRDSGFMGSCDDLLKETPAEATAPPAVTPAPPPPTALYRKDSFNNWSSDEETNLMMSKMRAFFKSMVASQPRGPRTGGKPPQLAYFESELTRLMKSVPGIKDEQVREIVEYLSSEDTWSDSYDSSDYTSSDLETGNKTALQEEISASCRQIINKFEAREEAPEERVYQKLVNSFSRVEPEENNSPPLIEKVMQHIGSRLVALMHEVSGGETSPGRRRRLPLSTTSEEEEEEWTTALPRSKSHDPLLEESMKEASDNERFSWRGSFESALLADSRTRLAVGRRSAGDLVVGEELDRVRSLDSMGGELAGRPPATNSLPRLPTTPAATAQIYKAHSVASVKSARYRAPGYRPASAPPRHRRRPPPLPTNGQEEGSQDSNTLTATPTITSRKEDEDPVDRLICHRTSLGSRSDSLASVYSGAGEGRLGSVPVRGEVQFGLQYNYKLSSLEIHVKQCRDLAAIDTKRNRSDPYVKVYLLPDKSKAGKRKTRVKKHTLNPVFEETLRFQVGQLGGLENRTLWLSVWHSDMFGRNDFLGEVRMPLENKVFDDPLPKFYTLQERSEPLEELSSKGELIVGLKFVPPSDDCRKRPSKGTLYVLVKEAKNLPAVKNNGTSDPFCKSYLLPDKGRGSKQKAPVVRKTCNPVWNHTLTYQNVSLAELMERGLELTLWDHDRLASNEFLGGVRLSLGTGKHNGRPVDWMDSTGNEVTLWRQMSEKPNFWVESCLPLRPTLETLRKT